MIILFYQLFYTFLCFFNFTILIISNIRSVLLVFLKTDIMSNFYHNLKFQSIFLWHNIVSGKRFFFKESFLKIKNLWSIIIVNFINIFYEKELLALYYSNWNALYCGLFIIYITIGFNIFEAKFSYISHTF